jgi:hypothetical protein
VSTGKRKERFEALDKSMRKVRLVNQFHMTGRDVLLSRTKQFCSAVNKNGEGILDPSAHLTCYSARPKPSTNLQVITTNQFGEQQLRVQQQGTRLCVPSVLFVEPTATPTPNPTVTPTSITASTTSVVHDHYEMYKAKTASGTTKFESINVNLDDPSLDFDETVRVRKPDALGVPTDKNGEGISYPTAHLVCYAISAPRFRITDVEVVNQFGQFRLKVKRPTSLCVPSTKQVVTGN